MQVIVSVHTQDVEETLLYKPSVEMETFSGYVEGDIEEIIDAVIENLKFQFDREDAEAVVLKFPELTR
jgi:hypothetical protein